MPHETRGVIAGGKGEPVRLETIIVPDPGPGEVLVRVRASGDREHIRANNALMFDVVQSGNRRLPSATDVLAIATSPSPGWTDIDLPRQDFLGGADWNTAFNWEGNQVPGIFDDAFVRTGGSVTMSDNGAVDNLLVGDGSDVRTNGFNLIVVDKTTVRGSGSRFI